MFLVGKLLGKAHFHLMLGLNLTLQILEQTLIASTSSYLPN